jgi:hypothetical protein
VRVQQSTRAGTSLRHTQDSHTATAARGSVHKRGSVLHSLHQLLLSPLSLLLLPLIVTASGQRQGPPAVPQAGRRAGGSRARAPTRQRQRLALLLPLLPFALPLALTLAPALVKVVLDGGLQGRTCRSDEDRSVEDRTGDSPTRDAAWQERERNKHTHTHTHINISFVLLLATLCQGKLTSCNLMRKFGSRMKGFQIRIMPLVTAAAGKYVPVSSHITTQHTHRKVHIAQYSQLHCAIYIHIESWQRYLSHLRCSP